MGQGEGERDNIEMSLGLHTVVQLRSLGNFHVFLAFGSLTNEKCYRFSMRVILGVKGDQPVWAAAAPSVLKDLQRWG